MFLRVYQSLCKLRLIPSRLCLNTAQLESIFLSIPQQESKKKTKTQGVSQNQDDNLQPRVTNILEYRSTAEVNNMLHRKRADRKCLGFIPLSCLRTS